MTVNGQVTKLKSVTGAVTKKGEDNMEEIKLTVRALAAQMGISIETLAEKCEISGNHLKQVSAGNVAMTAFDLKQLSKVTGVPASNIYVKHFDD